MSLCSVSVYLLVVLGAVITSGFPRQHRAPCQHVSRNLTPKQELIANELGLKQPEVGKTELFSFVNSINTSCQRNNDIELMDATLDVYTRIFSNILEHDRNNQHHAGLLDQVSEAKRSEIESVLKDLQDNMVELKKLLHHLNHNKEDILRKLKQIKVDDLMDQKRALAEYLGVFQAASVIARGC